VIYLWSVQDAAIEDLAVLCVAYDATGRIIVMNRRAEDLFKESRATLAGRRRPNARPGAAPNARRRWR
jgi:PAS domain-containing protein